VHLSADRGCRPLSFVLTPGQSADSPQFRNVLGKIKVRGPLEVDTKPLLERMFKECFFIERADQEKLALWATMKAILIDAGSENPIIPRGFGRDLRILKRPHAGTHVWVAAFSDDKNFLNAVPWIIHPKDDSDNAAPIAYLVTIVVFRVIVQVLIPFSEGDLTGPSDFNGSVKAIWPIRDSQIDWPPPYQFANDSLRALATRIYDNREEVVSHVVLKEAVRQYQETPEG
jgi:hypothetical protein